MVTLNEDFILYIKERCYQWADWYIRGNYYGLGFPSCSLEYRLLKEGFMRRMRSLPILQTNEGAEEIEKLVAKMSEQNYQMALVLRCHYFASGSLRRQAKYLQISHTKFKYLLDMAHQWLAGRLSGH